MKDILSKLLIFAAGAGIGSAVTWKFVKTKYEQIAQEEIDSVKEYYRKKDGETEATDESASVQLAFSKAGEAAADGKAVMEGFANGFRNISKKVSDADVTSYNTIIQTEGYSEIGEEVADTDGPYIIDADEFGDSYEYDTDSLVYYSDNILATETYEVIDDIDHIIGIENLTKFDDDNVIFVRNDVTRHDYEVTREDRTFAEVVGIYPPEDE